MSKNARSRRFCFLLYPEDETHVKALNIIKEKYKYAYILHDKDVYDENVYDEEKNILHGEGELKKAHYHVIVEFVNPRYKSGLCKTLGIEENYCQTCGDKKLMLTYLIHFDIPEKYQYDKNEVQGPLRFDLFKILKTINMNEDEKISRIFDIIDNHRGYLSISNLNRYMLKQGLWSEYKRCGSFILRHLDEHNHVDRLHDKMGYVYDKVNYQVDMEEFFDEH